MSTAPDTSTDPDIWPSRIRFFATKNRGISVKVDVRTVWVSVILLVVTLLVGFWSLSLGTDDSTRMPLSTVLDALTGTASAATEQMVLDWRMPRVLAAIIGGAALGVSGAIFQTMTRNPLGSPDIIGFNAGAYTGALIAGLGLGLGSTGSSIGALIGGLLTGVAIYFLAFRDGVQGYRLIIVGVGLSSMLSALNGYLLVNANVENAVSAASWGAGSFATLDYADVVPMLIAVIILFPALTVVSPSMRLLEFGDDSARSKGVHTQRVQIQLLVIGVGLTAFVTAVAGPIAFVALMAPQVAMRIARTPGIPLVTTAAVGATLLVISDAIARTLLAPTQLPVGVVTATIGGVYLLWLLIVQARKVSS
ncbi:FecCD family ABC transporter permease [Aldersonia kunmingensis]|uniref:FecCD family ABC transporter permease n=1 Tax=Aldersonia kunmingensis TaxID=408066 RepID=UPI00082EBACE|nr:iron chelate uptake ABC transporter family permease subunit [Aldersonia kunmingensis]